MSQSEKHFCCGLKQADVPFCLKHGYTVNPKKMKHIQVRGDPCWYNSPKQRFLFSTVCPLPVSTSEPVCKICCYVRECLIILTSEVSAYYLNSPCIERVSMCSQNIWEHVLLCGSSVSVCSLCSQHHMLFPPGWRLGLSVKGGAGGGMRGKWSKGVREGEGRRVEWATHTPVGKETGVGGVGSRCGGGRESKERRGLEREETTADT